MCGLWLGRSVGRQGMDGLIEINCRGTHEVPDQKVETHYVSVTSHLHVDLAPVVAFVRCCLRCDLAAYCKELSARRSLKGDVRTCIHRLSRVSSRSPCSLAPSVCRHRFDRPTRLPSDMVSWHGRSSHPFESATSRRTLRRGS